MRHQTARGTSNSLEGRVGNVGSEGDAGFTGVDTSMCASRVPSSRSLLGSLALAASVGEELLRFICKFTLWAAQT